jgi:hypothetical protein
MYPNVHGVVGAIVTISTYAVTKDTTITYIVGGLLAFASHDVMDRLGEKKYPSTKFLLLFEGSLFAIFCYLAYKSNLTILYVIGWICGNAIDFIDKKMGLSIINPTKYPSFNWFKCHKREPNLDFNLSQTILISILATLILFFLSIK